MSADLLPCPHCGCRKISVMWVDWSYRAVCHPDDDGCGAYGPGRQDKADAIAAWRRRAPVSADVVPVKPVDELLGIKREVGA